MEKLKELLKEKIKKEWNIEIGEGLLEEIIHNEQRMKMFKKIGTD